MKRILFFALFCITAKAVSAQCISGFTFVVNGPTVNFTNTSVVSGNPWYQWNFGDNTYAWGTSSNPDAVHSYNAAGTYTVTLIATDSSFMSCSDTFSTAVTVTVGCNNLSVSVSSTAASACSACDGVLTATVNGGNPPFAYQWSNASTTASLSNLCVGGYQLIVTDAVGCVSNVTANVNCPDSCHAEFYSNISGNTVYLTNMSNDTFVSTFQWDFGDASGFNGTNPGSHTYTNSGTYNIMLIMVNSASPCTDTIIHSVTAGGPNSCSAGFSLQQDSFNLLQWYAYAAVTGQPPFTYLWDFGDTTTSTLATPTHTYAYMCHHVICLTVTDANGCASTYCDSSMLHRMLSPGMQYFTVVSMSAPAGIENNAIDNFHIWPNPANDVIHIELAKNTESTITVVDLPGNVVMKRNMNGNSADLDISSLPAGYYSLLLNNNEMSVSRKIVIVR